MFGGVLFFLLTMVLGGLTVLGSVLAWRTRHIVYFIMGLVFGCILLVIVAVNHEYYLFSLLNPESDMTSILLLIFLGVSTYFLVSSQMKNTGYYDSDVTDAGISELINETADSDEEYEPTDKDYLNHIIEDKEEDDEFTVR